VCESAGRLATEPFLTTQKRKGARTVDAVVSVPDSDEPEEGHEVPAAGDEAGAEANERVQTQFRLLQLGAGVG